MPRVQRASDVIEIISERAIYFGTFAIGIGVLAGLLVRYQGQTGVLVPLGFVLLTIFVGVFGYSVYTALQVRKVVGKPVICPFCEVANEVVGDANEDFDCVNCHRMIPIVDGAVLPVSQVRCGYCNELNFYSEKTEALLCEKCNHEIPLARDDGAPKKSIPMGFAVVDDEAMYELLLVGHGHKEEELIQCLQQMLALNRNQVKQMLGDLPVTLLTGITRRKAEMLKAQLSIHDGEVEFRQMEEARY
ncbi:hypothetical protein [Fimbriimonas ginsengisoli]|uniref:Uncharacterized protein n=1 Tax=Fimbriimonas ginsengisoli Gsoil 348 TaxID=661478 RepID=A0A068NWG9_FIMGI|nr:hypothetical protein [Fimbriimonas ginsengisoli]AIE87873.1 hypothetical protein OP10G_4505 [Fimbriimonas ginsengisoli Gsoil 348]